MAIDRCKENAHFEPAPEPVYPEGTLSITQNGTYDVTDYASADVNVSGGSGDILKGLIERDITEIVVPQNITRIGTSAFSDCRELTNATIPEGVVTIDDYAFSNCYLLANISLPNTLKKIGAYAFSKCTALKSIALPSLFTEIGSYGFQNSGLESVVLPGSMSGANAIGIHAFDRSKLKNIIMETGVTKINGSAFEKCSDLETVVLPNTLTNIGASAFSGCSSLASITCKATTPPSIITNTFSNVPADCPIYVPASSVEYYKNAANWSFRADYIQAIPE